MFTRKTDNNHREILEAARTLAGVSIFSTHTIGRGFPDVVVGYRGKNYLFEIKNGDQVKSARKLTDREGDFFRVWTGQITVIFSINDIKKIIKYNEPV